MPTDDDYRRLFRQWVAEHGGTAAFGGDLDGSGSILTPTVGSQGGAAVVAPPVAAAAAAAPAVEYGYGARPSHVVVSLAMPHAATPSTPAPHSKARLAGAGRSSAPATRATAGVAESQFMTPASMSSSWASHSAGSTSVAAPTVPSFSQMSTPAAPLHQQGPAKPALPRVARSQLRSGSPSEDSVTAPVPSPSSVASSATQPQFTMPGSFVLTHLPSPRKDSKGLGHTNPTVQPLSSPTRSIVRAADPPLMEPLKDPGLALVMDPVAELASLKIRLMRLAQQVQHSTGVAPPELLTEASKEWTGMALADMESRHVQASDFLAHLRHAHVRNQQLHEALAEATAAESRALQVNAQQLTAAQQDSLAATAQIKALQQRITLVTAELATAVLQHSGCAERIRVSEEEAARLQVALEDQKQQAEHETQEKLKAARRESQDAVRAVQRDCKQRVWEVEQAAADQVAQANDKYELLADKLADEQRKCEELTKSVTSLKDKLAEVQRSSRARVDELETTVTVQQERMVHAAGTCAQCGSLKQALHAAQEQCDEARSEATRSNARVRELESQVQALEYEMQRVRHAQEAAQSDRSYLEASLSEKQVAMHQRDVELSTLNRQLQHQQAEASRLRDAHSEAQAALARSQGELSQLQAQFRQVQQEHRELLSSHATCEVSTSKYESQLAELTAMLQALRSPRGEGSESSRSAAVELLQEWQHAVQEKEAQVFRLEADVRDLQRANQELRAQLATSGAAVEAEQAAKAALETRVAALHQRVANADAEAQDATRRLATCEQRLSDECAAHRSTNQQVGALQDQLASLKLQVTAQQQQHDSMLVRNNELVTQLAAASGRATTAEGEGAATKVTLATVQQRAEQLQKHCDSLEQQLASAIAAQAADVEAHQTREAGVRQELQRVAADREEAHTRVRVLQASVTELQAQLAAADQAAGDLRRTAQSAKEDREKFMQELQICRLQKERLESAARAEAAINPVTPHEELVAKLRAAEDRAAVLQPTLHKLQALVDEYKGQVAHLEARLVDMKAQLNEETSASSKWRSKYVELQQHSEIAAREAARAKPTIVIPPVSASPARSGIDMDGPAENMPTPDAVQITRLSALLGENAALKVQVNGLLRQLARDGDRPTSNEADDAARLLEDMQRWQQEAVRLAAENSSLSVALHEAVQSGKVKDETIHALRHDVTRLSSEYEALFNAYSQVSKELTTVNQDLDRHRQNAADALKTSWSANERAIQVVAAHAKDAATLALLQDQVGTLQQQLKHVVAVNRRLSTQLGTEAVDTHPSGVFTTAESPVDQVAKSADDDSAPRTPLPQVSVRRLETDKRERPGDALSRVRDTFASPAGSVVSVDDSPSSHPLPRVTVELAGASDQ